MSARFNIKSADPQAVAALQQSLDLPHFIATTLVARGITQPDQAQEFLHPSLERDWRNPYEIPGISDVADVISDAIKAQKRILVFGDFDLDGISATTVLTRGLRALGAEAIPFIPHRFDEGYGLTAAAINRFMQYEPDLVVTVDNGIACKNEAAILAELGVQLVVTDHHEPADLVPEGVPVADPKCDKDCPSGILAGVGVALKLVQILGGRFGQPHLWASYTDFATLGTVADLMPMRDENRALVADGLARMNEAPRPCIAALRETSGTSDKVLSATNLGFSIVPRLNAAGRMGNADLALELLMADDFSTASSLAQQLEGVNDQRRAIEAELSEIAKAQASETYHGQRALVVSGAGWHEGVKGIVASRLVNTYGVPCLLFTIDGDEARGSGRSVGQVNLFAAVESCADILTRFGGHEAAVGVTLPVAKLPEFEERLCAYMDKLPEGSFHPLIEIDACVPLEELSLQAVEKLDAISPFGQENPVPVYLARNVTITRCRAVGAEKNHFSCSLSNGRESVAGIMFHCNDIEHLMRTDCVVNAAFELQVDEWRGRKSVKAMLKSLTPTRCCAALEACLDADNLTFVGDLYATNDAELCADTHHTPEEIEAYEAKQDKSRSYWEQRAQDDPAGLERSIIRAIIGDGQLHEAQQRILDHLQQGENVLGVMVTGRGKSLTFQVQATMLALSQHEASLFVYPLRALIADQAYHLRSSLEPFGINIITLTGESTPEERALGFAGLADGSVDIALTTPEFLAWHAEEFARTRRMRFVVFDEAHHIGLARAGQRPAYASIGSAFARLGEPRPMVLALTATANNDVAQAVQRELPINACVYDASDRPNLELVDRRSISNRDDYLANLIATGEKTLIFVNSRERSVALARLLRKKVPQVAPLVGFYNAGLTRDERKRIEELFRTDALSVLVATSAFGEGVDIANIRHVVLYHLPFNEIEFNQMSGRAGRDGKPAKVHLLYSKNDAAINDRLLHDITPEHDCLAQVYRCLRRLQAAHAGTFFAITDDDLAKAASTDLFPINKPSAACGVAVFRELGLVETHSTMGPGGIVRQLRVVNSESKVELTDSVRYREGLDELDIFRSFRDWALRSATDELSARITHPILPDSVRQ